MFTEGRRLQVAENFCKTNTLVNPLKLEKMVHLLKNKKEHSEDTVDGFYFSIYWSCFKKDVQYEQSNMLKQQDVRPKYGGYFDNVPETFIKNVAEGCLSQQKILSFFFYGNEHYTLNIKNNSHLAPWLLWVPGIQKK